MHRRALVLLTFLGLWVLAFTQNTPAAGPDAVEGQAPTPARGLARVWFLRASDSPRGSVQAAAPTIFANGAPVASLPVNSKFYRDFAPGTYSFTVQSYGLPTDQAATVQLAAGTQTYLQVQWAASWQFGFPEAGWSFKPNTFVITPMSPQMAKAYLPTLAFLGSR